MLQPRDVNVDFSGMPECSSKVCIPKLGSSLGCGSGVTAGCFCGKPNPLYCAWTVDWACWNRTEDWYDTQCPGKPLVDLTGIPSCARNCFNGSNICMEFTSNCVCSQPRPDCTVLTTTCDTSGVAEYDAWYSKSCEYNLTDPNPPNPSTTTPPPSTTTTPTPPPADTTPSGSNRSLSKGAIAGVAIGAFAGTITLGALLYFFFFRKPESSGQDYSTGPPAAVEMEDSSHPKVGSHLMSDGVHSVPPVEVSGDYK